MLEEGVGLGVRWLASNGWIAPDTAFRPVCYVEREITAAARLVARMEETRTHHKAPVWDDVGSFDGHPWRDRVHCITAGYPCQPFSQAGLRRGKRDERYLWPDIARIIAEVQPVEIILENVAGHLSLGFQEVATCLQDMGYRVKAGLFSAAETGARHERKRLIVLARQHGWWMQLGHPDCRHEQRLWAGQSKAAREAPGSSGELADAGSTGLATAKFQRKPEASWTKQGDRSAAAEPRSALLANAADARHRDRQSRSGPCRARRRGVPEPDRRSLGLELADANHVDRWGGGSDRKGETGFRWSKSESIDRRLADTTSLFRRGIIGCPQDGLLPGMEQGIAPDAGAGLSLPLFAPGPSEHAAWLSILEQARDLEPAICRDADGLADRVDQLHGLGKGVVPLQIAYAYSTLHIAFAEEFKRHADQFRD
jgi:DNA (cytosine-5)-methyltransferase 1|tara:strand:- start:3239 stop:4516 length:1278 start_codon:yes stop_codon:yes gene_type:complete